MTKPSSGRLDGGRFGFGELLLTVALLVMWFLALRPAVDPDYGWHIENGRRVLDGTAFSGRDLYSWTATNEWIVHEWLIEAGMSTVHDGIGVAANSVLAATLWTLAFLLVAVRLRARGFGWGVTTAAVTLGFFCTMMSVGVRPQVLELVYLAVILIILDRHAAEFMRSRKLLAVTAVLAVLWVNTHGSFPLLIGVLGLSALGALVMRRSEWRSLAGAAAVAAVASLANPWGWRIFEFATQSMTSGPTLASIDEWKRPQLLTGSLIPFDIAVVLAVVGVVLLAARVSKSAGSSTDSQRPRAEDVLIFLAMLYLALSSGRHVMLFGIGAAPLMAWTLSQVKLPRVLNRNVVPSEADARGFAIINVTAAVIVAGAIVWGGWGVVNPAAQGRAMAARYPVGMVSYLRSLVNPSSRTFNEYSWGGFLIGNGITPVFIDGRSELYGDEQLVRYGRIIHLSAGWKETFDSLGIELAILRRDSPLASELSALGWSPAAGDSIGFVLRPPR